MLLETVTSEKPLYTADPLRPSLDPYVQAAFIEMQVLLAVQKALEQAFSRDWTL